MGESCRWMQFCEWKVEYLCRPGLRCAARDLAEKAYRLGVRDGLLQAKQIVEAGRFGD